MMNLLIETLADLDLANKKPSDISFIGSLSGEYQCTWDEFQELADVSYDNGYGAAQVALDLVIGFKDGTRLCRYEYDGAESWSYVPNIPVVGDPKPIRRLLSPTNASGWRTLAALNRDTPND